MDFVPVRFLFVLFLVFQVPRWICTESERLVTKRGLPIPLTLEHHKVSILVQPNSLFKLKKRASPVFSWLHQASPSLPKDPQHGFQLVLKSSSLGTFQLILERNHDWISPTFQAVREDNHGFKTIHDLPLHCFYKGSVLGHPTSKVALSTCDGFNGVIHMNETWVLHPLNLQHNETRPLSRRDVEEHVLVKEVPFRSTCASVDTQLLSSWIEQANNMSSIASSTTSTPVKKTINLMLVSDYLRYQLLGSWTELSLLEMMNYFNVLYQTAGPLFSATSMSLSFQLVGVYTATSSSWLNASSSSPIDADTLLTSFCRWQSSPQILTLLRYDSIHLFTAQTVTSSQTSGKIQGYSSVGSICDTFRHCGFISSGLTPMLATQAHVLLHEIGHQLGASHDGVGNTCAVNGFIMESNACEGCGNLSSTWSECSVKAISSFFNSHDTTCLDDTPSLCGNGILDAGEQCDSGTSLGSACCYGNCTLKPPAQCDDQNGNCCLQCQFLAKNTTCRRQVSGDARQSCDVEDACSGTSAFCENQVKPNGTNCFTDPSQPQWLDGFCNRGTCESRFQVCQKLGYAYNEQCENPSSPCVLICWSTSSMSCLKFSYPSTPPKLYFVPDFSNCTINNKSGYCMVGQCVPSKGMARFLPFQWTLQIGVIFVFILIFS